MSTPKRAIGWFVGNLGVILLMMACMAAGRVFNSDNASLQVEDGEIQVKYQNGDWRPAGSDAAFDLIARLESIDPWTVAGKTLETDESTEIADGLQVGDLVHVRGIILEDNVWLAKSIELAEEQSNPVLVLIGRVDSVDPWVVNGISLTVTDETEIQGTITPGAIVRVEILIVEDGTWQALSIILLENIPDVPECTIIIATIASIEGNEINLLGWPALSLPDDVEIEGVDETLSPGQTILIVICPGDDGQIVIVQIIILQIDDGETVTPTDGDKVLICHKPSKNAHTLSVSSSAVPAHLGHGDTLGPCP